MTAGAPSRDPGGAMTIAQARRALAERLRKAGIETPDLDARVLVGAACGLDLTGLAREADRVLDNDTRARIADFAARRIKGEPVARILGRKEFWSLDLSLTPAALVPRPDTETIVAAALEALGAARREQQWRIADIGTGSGAILLALLGELPHATGIGTDISDDALACARANATALGLDARATFERRDITEGLAGPFDLIVSNPPYIRSGEIDALPAEVRDHDPRLALDGGPDGLSFYRALAEAAPRLLAPGGWLIVETGFDQTEAVAALFAASGLVPDGAPLCDAAGLPRGVRAQSGRENAD